MCSAWLQQQKGGRTRGKQVYLGGYVDELAAARAYDRAALKYWPDTAILNVRTLRNPVSKIIGTAAAAAAAAVAAAAAAAITVRAISALLICLLHSGAHVLLHAVVVFQGRSRGQHRRRCYGHAQFFVRVIVIYSF